MMKFAISIPMTLLLVLLLPLPARGEEPGSAGGADLSTPYRTLQHFIFSSRDGDFGRAADAFDMSLLRDQDPATLARRFKFVLDRHIWIDWDTVPDSAMLSIGPEDGRGAEALPGDPGFTALLRQVAAARGGPLPDQTHTLGSIPYRGRSSVNINLVRQRTDAGEHVWRFGPNTVRMMPNLWEVHGTGWLEGRIPAWMEERMIGDLYAWQWAGLGVITALGIVGVLILRFLFLRLGRALLQRRGPAGEGAGDIPILVTVALPLALMITLILVYLAAMRGLGLSVPIQEQTRVVLLIALTVAATWLALRLGSHGIHILEKGQIKREKDAVRKRAITTRMMVLRRVSTLIFLLIGAGAALSQIDAFRTLGASLLASAGVAGLAIGLAAQRTLSNLIAGIQIAITQPVRVGDSVVIQNEWGWVEDITLTYVVVRVWDLRRLVLPINHLLENPFQNWTIRDPHLIGTVFIHADHRIDIGAMRGALKEILEGTELWDRRVPPVLVVTDARQETVELRALCSAEDAGAAWDLRCHVREKLLQWLREHEGGRFLPRTRVTLAPSETAAGATEAMPRFALGPDGELPPAD